MTAPNVLVPIAVLPPGTNQYNLVGLSPDTPYTVVLAHQEPPPSTGFTAPAEVSFTSSASVGTLAAPDDPLAFVIPQPPSHGGMPICGFACYNTEPVPGTSIIVQMATETSIGSGTYGSWQTVDSIPTNPLSWAVKTLTLQQDGLRRQFQGQATRAGCNPSSFTPVVTLNPSVALAPTDYPVAVPLVTYTPQDVQQPDRMAVTIVATYTPPTASEFDHMEYLVAQRQANGTYSAPQTVVGGKTGTDTIVTMPASLNGIGVYYQIQAVTVTNGEAGDAPIPSASASTSLPVRTYGPTLGIYAPPLSNAPTIVAVPGAVATAGSATFFITFDAGTAYIMAYLVSYGATDPGTVLTVEGSANYVGPNIVPPANPAVNQMFWTAALGLNNYIVATFVPYNSSGIRGTPLTYKLKGANPTQPSAPSMAIETWPGSGGGNWAFPGWVVIKVTLGTPVTAGDWLWLSSFSAGAGSLVHVVTPTDITNGYAILTDATAIYPNTYSYGVIQFRLADGGANAGGLSVTMRAGFTLPTPTLVWSSAGSQIGKLVQVSTPANTYPPDATADIQYRVGSAGPPWVDLGPLPAGDNSFAAVPASFSGSIYGTATVACSGYTTSAAGTGSTTYP